MTQQKLRIDFYRISMPDNSPALEKLIQDVGNLNDFEQRNFSVNGAPIRLQTLFANAHFLEGEMLRIRMNEVPNRAKLAGSVTPIDLDDDEGIGETTAFLYHSGLRVLLLQSTRSGVSASSFAKYFSSFLEQSGIVRGSQVNNLPFMSEQSSHPT